MMPGSEEPFKWWFDFHLFSEMDSAEASKERRKKTLSISLTGRPAEYKWLLSYLALETCVTHVHQRHNDLLCAVEWEFLQQRLAFSLFYTAARSLGPGEDKV